MRFSGFKVISEKGTSMTLRNRLVASAFALALLATSSALAQHGHGHLGHGHINRRGHGHIAHHHGSHFGHNTWNWVVPHRDQHHHHGAYYVEDNHYYYTPAPVQRIVVNSAQRYPVHVVQRPVAPVPIEFGGFARCEDLAGRLEYELNLMCLDMHYNYHQTEISQIGLRFKNGRIYIVEQELEVGFGFTEVQSWTARRLTVGWMKHAFPSRNGTRSS
jgi:hypothetical protein